MADFLQYRGPRSVQSRLYIQRVSIPTENIYSKLILDRKALSRFVRSDAGIQLRKRVFAEANAQLELLKPNALKLALSSE